LSLKAGNDYCRQGLYEKALEEYNKIDQNSPLYSQSVFNIWYTTKKILKKRSLQKKQVGNNISIVFICDNKFVIPTSVAITSLIANKQPKTCYEIYIIVDNVDKDNLKKLYAFSSSQVAINIIEACSDK
jgi:hypothetical protein